MAGALEREEGVATQSPKCRGLGFVRAVPMPSMRPVVAGQPASQQLKLVGLSTRLATLRPAPRPCQPSVMDAHSPTIELAQLSEDASKSCVSTPATAPSTC